MKNFNAKLPKSKLSDSCSCYAPAYMTFKAIEGLALNVCAFV